MVFEGFFFARTSVISACMTTLVNTLGLIPSAWYSFTHDGQTGFGFSTSEDKEHVYVVGQEVGYHRYQLLNYLNSLPDAKALGESGHHAGTKVSLSDVTLLAPIPRPTSFRDGYAFRQHVESARKNRGLPMIPEYDEFPVFYFGNANGITGPGVVEVQPAQQQELDFELEIAIVIGKKGKNIPIDKAHEHIAGITILNDWSARALQMQEMKLSLGPAKGKDFATSIGPSLVPMQALASQIKLSEKGIEFTATMETLLNNESVSKGNARSMTYTFSEIIERASDSVWLEAGDVIGSGTVGTGCFLELNTYPGANKRWLKDGDIVSMKVEGLGELTHKIRFLEKRYEK